MAYRAGVGEPRSAGPVWSERCPHWVTALPYHGGPYSPFSRSQTPKGLHVYRKLHDYW